MEIPFLGKFVPKNQNCHFKLKFGTYTNSSIQNPMVMFNFLGFEWKYTFWANLVQQIKNVTLTWNLVPTLKAEIWYLLELEHAEFNGDVYSSCFWLEIPFLGKFAPKNHSCHFKLKFGTYTNSNMQNSMVMFIFFVFDRKYPFWANLVQNIKIATLTWNLVPTLIRILRIQWCVSLFLFLSGNALFGQIWSEKSNLSLYAQIW